MTDNFDSIIKDLEDKCKWEWEINGGTNDSWGMKGRLETAKQLKEIVEKAIDKLSYRDLGVINIEELRKALGVDSQDKSKEYQK